MRATPISLTPSPPRAAPASASKWWPAPICEPSGGRRSAPGGACRRCTPDYRQMVAQEAPDLVAVCTTASGLQKPAAEAPNAEFRGDSHAELTVALAQAGVPMLYVEKAMASSAQMAEAARAACERHGTLFNTGVLRRFDNRYQALREAVAAGVIGEPRAAVHFAATNLMHGHVHSIDTLSYLLGDPPLEAVRGELIPRQQRIVGNHVPRDPNATFQLRLRRRRGGVVGTGRGVGVRGPRHRGQRPLPQQRGWGHPAPDYRCDAPPRVERGTAVSAGARQPGGGLSGGSGGGLRVGPPDAQPRGPECAHRRGMRRRGREPPPGRHLGTATAGAAGSLHLPCMMR